MRRSVDPVEFEILRQLPGAGSLTLRGEQAGPLDGDSPPLVLLHGLSATRRNVVQGSRQLMRRGYRVVAYDARGHGASDPAPAPDAYGYPERGPPLGGAPDGPGLGGPVLVGSSVGAPPARAFPPE